MSATLDEAALMEACQELASRTMFDSEPEPTKIREAGLRFFSVAREHSGFVPAGEDPNVVVRAVRYIAEVHGVSYLRDETAWFHQTLNALLELVHPSEVPGLQGSRFLEDIAAGILKLQPRDRDSLSECETDHGGSSASRSVAGRKKGRQR